MTEIKKMIMITLLLCIFSTGIIADGFPVLNYASGTRTLDSGVYPSNIQFVNFDYYIGGVTSFGGYTNITEDLDTSLETEQISVLGILILNEAGYSDIEHIATCAKLYQVYMNITDGLLAWTYTTLVDTPMNIHIVYWYKLPNVNNERRITFDYEHWDSAYYQPEPTTTIEPITTTNTTTITTTTSTSGTTTTTGSITTTRTIEAPFVEDYTLLIVGAIAAVIILVVGYYVLYVSKKLKVYEFACSCGRIYNKRLKKCPGCGRLTRIEGEV